MEVRLRLQQPILYRTRTLSIFSVLILLGTAPNLHAAANTVSAKPPIPSDLAVWRLPPAPSAASRQEVDLGRQLFFDPRLTGADATSCAQCHVPGLEWSDGRPRPMPQQLTLGRNTIALVNVGYRKSFFWDGRATSLEAAIAGHLTENEGTGEHSGREVVAGIAALDGYRRQFTAIFHSPTITVDEISQALAAYLQTLVVHDTPFDRWINGDSQAIPDDAKQGFRVFTGKAGCVHCHTPPYFSDFRFHNTGMNSIDPGHYEVTGKAEDRSAFRTPDLRQVGRTAPYMHNGSLPTLADVIDFYNKGGDRLDPGNELKPLGLSDTEQHALLMFLDALTDPTPPATEFPALPAIGEAPASPATIH
ncbi:MAG TPA: cytochrome c peroxidase [Mariprofundaceae bacterium]|nr:cytochrome c peroxidase [Mariprofundaceae bacterium]